MAKKTIADLTDLNGKRVLVRVDFNVAIKPKLPATRDEARRTLAVEAPVERLTIYRIRLHERTGRFEKPA